MGNVLTCEVSRPEGTRFVQWRFILFFLSHQNYKKIYKITVGCILFQGNQRIWENRSHVLHPISHDSHPEANGVLVLCAFEPDTRVIPSICIFIFSQHRKRDHLFETLTSNPVISKAAFFGGKKI